jgi:hypothetical protein
MRGIYEAFRPLGGVEVEGTATAAMLKSVESVLIIASSTRKFHIFWRNNMSPCWALSVRRVMGTKHVTERYETVDEFSSLRQARAEAIRLARNS